MLIFMKCLDLNGVVTMMNNAALDRTVLDRTIALINGKGGVGKTTLCANIGGVMAKSGARVLLVDIDPQGNLGYDLGYADDQRDDSGRSFSAALQGLMDVNVLRDIRPNLDVIVGGSALHGAAAALASPDKSQVDARDALAIILAPIADQYDLILIDCPPGSLALQSAAIGAAHWVIAPAKIDEATGRGLSELADRLESVVETNPHISLLGVVLFDIETTATRVAAGTRSMVAELLGGKEKLYKSFVRHSVTVAQQARSYGKLVHELDEFAKKQPKWWQSLREGKPAGERFTDTATSVADDMHAIAQETMARIARAEEGK